MKTGSHELRGKADLGVCESHLLLCSLPHSLQCNSNVSVQPGHTSEASIKLALLFHHVQATPRLAQQDRLTAAQREVCEGTG